MGRASGSTICYALWNKLREYVPEEQRVKALAHIITTLGNEQDWDTEEEIAKYWPEADAALTIACEWWPEYKEERPDFFRYHCLHCEAKALSELGMAGHLWIMHNIAQPTEGKDYKE